MQAIWRAVAKPENMTGALREWQSGKVLGGQTQRLMLQEIKIEEYFANSLLTWQSGKVLRSFFPLFLIEAAFHAGGAAEVFLAIDPDMPFADQDVADGLHLAGGGYHLVKNERDFHNASTTSSMRTSSFRKKRSS